MRLALTDLKQAELRVIHAGNATFSLSEENPGRRASGFARNAQAAALICPKCHMRPRRDAGRRGEQDLAIRKGHRADNDPFKDRN